MELEDEDEITLRLLTVLNAVNSKRPLEDLEQDTPSRPAKLNRKKGVSISEDPNLQPAANGAEPVSNELRDIFNVEKLGDDGEGTTEASMDPYNLHFGPDSKFLSASTREDAEKGNWSMTMSLSKLGQKHESLPVSLDAHETGKPTIVSKLQEASNNMGKGLSVCQSSKHVHLNPLTLPIAQRNALTEMWSLVSTYQDVFATKTTLDTVPAMRSAVSLHLINHVNKIRRRVLKNNERIAHATPNTPPDNIQDQGFTRPSILVVLPFRSFAVRWLDSLINHLPDLQVENHARFKSEFEIPEGAVDKLSEAIPGSYPPDHVAMFQGNIDDDFRFGLKLTRKSVKLFSEFYSSDILVASAFGLRRAIEADGGDFLSSVEVLVIDQVDAITMQNWDHLLFCVSHLNELPKSAHSTDFSRVTPWFLDGQEIEFVTSLSAKFLRQSIMLSPYETPEMRSLFNKFMNLAGKVRLRSAWPPLPVPEGINQTFTQFESDNHVTEPDQRFNYFTTQLFPSIMKSAVQSSNTIIFFPSYFDFVRVRHWMRQQSDVTFAILFEESSNADISRARHAFFSGQKQLLLTTERFHFFRRYRIRGARNLIFYGPPDHPQFYSEYLSFPFLDEGVDPSDVTSRVLFSKWDVMRLERIVGTHKVKDLIGLE